jgi:hypothetical protein
MDKGISIMSKRRKAKKQPLTARQLANAEAQRKEFQEGELPHIDMAIDRFAEDAWMLDDYCERYGTPYAAIDKKPYVSKLYTNKGEWIWSRHHLFPRYVRPRRKSLRGVSTAFLVSLLNDCATELKLRNADVLAYWRKQRDEKAKHLRKERAKRKRK